MKNWVNLVLIILIIISIIIGVIYYPKVNDKIASHWNAKGEVDGQMNKFWGMFLLPIILILMYFFYLVFPRIDPLRKNIKSFRFEFDIFMIILFVFLFYVYLLTILYNIGIIINLSKFMIPAFAILIYYCGVLLRRSKRNWFIGIKTPWTLSNDYVWNRTHKIAGNLFKVSGILILISLFIYKLAYIILLVTILLSVAISVIYSYFIYRKIIKKKRT